MERFDDPRINEALELLNAVARDKKAELQAALEGRYSDLSALLGTFSEEVKAQASETYEAGRKKVEEVAGDIDRSVHRSPYAYIGGAALIALVFGFMLGRSRKD